MDGRSTTLLITLAFIGVGLTGCIESPDWLNRTSADEVAALQYRGLADEAALAWNPAAALVGVMAFELSDSPDPRMDSDPDPGNGLAPAWWYVYATPATEGRQVHAFKVTATGNVSSEDEAEQMARGIDHSTIEPITGWTVDSDAALRTAKTDDTFRQVAEGFNTSLVEGVARYEDRTIWWLSAFSVDGFVIAIVDASTGELVMATPMDMDFEMPDFAWGSTNPEFIPAPIHIEEQGKLAAGETAEFPFHASAPMMGMLRASEQTSLPGGNIWWQILDSEGDAIQEGRLGNFRGSDGNDFEIMIEEPGDYTLVFEYGAWVPLPVDEGAEYEFMLHLEGMQGMKHEKHETHDH